MVEAITPAQLSEAVGNRAFPDFVIEAFNTCILAAGIKGTDEVLQEDVICEILRLAPDLVRPQIFGQHLLDVEAHYEKAGWKVKYHKPAYYETWPAYWTFK